MTLTAHAPLPALVRSLARAGWGDLAPMEYRGVRTVLRALGDTLPDRAAEGTCTIPQIAQRACLSERWTARCLAVLEDAGLIVWTRGGVVAGTPVPSVIRVVKRAVLALVEAARPMREAADRARQVATRARLAEALRLRRPARHTGPYRRRSAHPELATSLPTPTGEVPPSDLPERSDDMTVRLPGVNSPVCDHGGDASRLPNGTSRCVFCRRDEAAKDAAEHGTTTTKPKRTRKAPDLLDYAALAAGERPEDNE